MCSNYPGIKFEPVLALGHKKTKLNICQHMLTSSTQLQNRSFQVVEKTRTSSKCQKMIIARTKRAKRAKILFFIVKCANLWGFCCRRRRGCLSSLTSDVATARNLGRSARVMAGGLSYLRKKTWRLDLQRNVWGKNYIQE